MIRITSRGGDELPSQADIIDEFGLFESGTGCSVQVSDAGRVFCLCRECQRWKAFLDGHHCEGASKGWPQYEVVTRDYIALLAAYIHGLAVHEKSKRPSAGTLRVLELGAGDGRLTHHLAESLRQLQDRDELPNQSSVAAHGKSSPWVDVCACDSGLRGLHKASPVGERVELMDYTKALELHQPHLVICCWQPMGTDWTKEVRATTSVQEYLLIGETDDGICGRPWETWGFSFMCESSSSSDEDEDETDEDVAAKERRTSEKVQSPSSMLRPFQADGFQRVELPTLSAVQICRTDERWSSRRHSRTVSFQRLSSHGDQLMVDQLLA
uniref:Uncharacterized protein n=1 Tax=Pyramimonas obovata TaxID=1411642 RepID=A0A7S0RVG8_9CHLO|mmetsp:Transcript_6379/g.12949  ORF Transcript_6379/g.12949 Transcript_6379/m.12949 type:complete len:326 (+) Transcript_6379:250-1227(+)